MKQIDLDLHCRGLALFLLFPMARNMKPGASGRPNPAPQQCAYFNKRAHGPWIAHLNPCQEERMFTTKYKSHSPTLKSILGITQIIAKAYQVTKFNQIIIICTISMSDFFTQPKKSGVYIRSNILIAKCDMQHRPRQII